MEDRELNALSEDELKSKQKELEKKVWDTTADGKRKMKPGAGKEMLVLVRINNRLKKIEADRKQEETSAKIDAAITKQIEKAKRLDRVKRASGLRF